MKVILAAHDAVSPFVTTWWTPVFVVIFLAIVIYALKPRNEKAFDEAANIPLRED